MPGIGELALDPTIFGASTILLNADHYDVYFRGMPIWNGKVRVPVISDFYLDFIYSIWLCRSFEGMGMYLSVML